MVVPFVIAKCSSFKKNATAFTLFKTAYYM